MIQHNTKRLARILLLFLAVSLVPMQRASAEVNVVTMARQFGIAFIPYFVIEDGKLIEKHARLLGLPDVTVAWSVLSGAAPMNDALLSGALSFGTGAAPSLILLWDRTRASRNPIKGIAAIATMPTYLNTRNPAIKTIRDFGPQDRIALPSVKLSNAAIALQMEAAKTWGDDQYARLDPQTVSMGHPDAAAQIMGNGEIASHFTSPPFHVLERRDPRIRTILTSVDIMGDATLTDVWTTQKFATENPTIVQAVFNAIKEAVDTINRDRSAAADLYLRLSGDKISKEDLMTVLSDPHIIYSNVPVGTMAFATFMHKAGTLKTQPGDWKDFFFPIAHNLPGN